nr:pentatricopeptide repeat-containing protein [Tanacetum cinerariifolium]
MSEDFSTIYDFISDSSNIEDYSQSESKSESDCSENSFDYLIDSDDEVIELWKRRFEYKYTNQEDNDNTVLETDKEKCTQSSKFKDVLNNDVVLTPLVKEHERNMKSLLKNLKGNHIEITDPFAIVEKQNKKFPIYDQQIHWKLKKPKLGEKFPNITQFKECLTYYALANGFSLWFDKSTNKKVIAKCRKRKEVTKDADIGKQRAFKKFFCNDEKPVCKWRCYDAIVELVMKKYKCIVSRTQCRRAKSFALNEGDAVIPYHYGYLRRVIALDGCFLKKSNSEENLTVVGRDGNNHIFPVASSVVTVENKDNWSWFLDLLADDFEVPNGNGLTFISDQHKGLIDAVKEIIPLVEHHQCARHIYEGFRKQFGGVEFRLLFWAASKATYQQLFQKIIEKIKRANPKSHDYLMKKYPKTWSRAYFNEGICCEAAKNGFSECFNSVLVSVRHKPIITMLESMRVIIMERMNTMRHLMEKWNGEICQNIQKSWNSERINKDYGMSFLVVGTCFKPKKKRIRASHEPKFSTTKISRAGAIMTCHNC